MSDSVITVIVSSITLIVTTFLGLYFKYKMARMDKRLNNKIDDVANSNINTTTTE